MSGTADYVKNYGGVSFKDKPFCDADNVALCEVFYMPLERVVSADLDAEPMDFADVCESLYEYNGCKHQAVGLVLPKHISVKLLEMSKHKRFAEMKVVGCSEYFSLNPAVQFAAATFLLPDGNNVVIFRGTDDTLTGWKEDLDLFVKKGIPSHKLAVDYLEKVAAKFDGNIIVCGHSKGGNVALYGALNCSDEVRARISCLYNNDGPGFENYSPFYTRQYQELLPKYRHLVPSTSFVGMLLAHDDDYTVVKSTRLLGPMQHDLATWKFDGAELQTAKELTLLGKIADLSLNEIILGTNESQRENLDIVIGKIIEGMGQSCLLGFAKHTFSSVKGAAQSWRSLDKGTRKTFVKIFTNSPKCIKDAISVVKAESEDAQKESATVLSPVTA